ncbi:hypothetical protein ES332_D01G186900v1, partial [Gossypium tomentosum]
YHIPNSLRNPIIRLTPNRGISFSPIRCAAPDVDADRKVSARLSQIQHLLQEAKERASSAGNEPTPQITLDHVTVSFARSGGPGGQNVNKGDMRFNVKQAYWHSDRIRERIMQMVRKEKLGDKITALHQLVSPFGKKNGGVLLQEDDIAVSNVRIDLTLEGKILSKASLGVYWLAGEAIQKLKTYQGLELGIDRFDVLAVKVEQVDIN